MTRIIPQQSCASNAEVEALIKKLGANPWPDGVKLCREHYDNLGGPIPDNIDIKHIDESQVKGVLVSPPNSDSETIVLFLHGGGYVFGSSKSHSAMAAQVALRLGCSVLVLDYRLAPEHRCPAAVKDACAAYNWLIQRGWQSEKIAIVGDSAGGGLAISMLVALRDAGKPLPAAAVCISPWVDLTLSGDSYITRKSIDPAVQESVVIEVADHYLGNTDPTNPVASPYFADLTGLPPLLIQVGAREILFSDAEMLRDKARAAQVDVSFEEWPGMIHVWHFYATDLSDGRKALDRVAQFLKKKLMPRNKPKAAHAS
ncbi:MAG: alpha/beta hydrolase [Paracoccaceae bacterium]